MSLIGDPAQELRPTHTVARTITTGVWTTDRCYSLDAGTLLHRIKIVQYLEWTCAGPFLPSVGRYELLDEARRGHDRRDHPHHDPRRDWAVGRGAPRPRRRG